MTRFVSVLRLWLCGTLAMLLFYKSHYLHAAQKDTLQRNTCRPSGAVQPLLMCIACPWGELTKVAVAEVFTRSDYRSFRLNTMMFL